MHFLRQLLLSVALLNHECKVSTQILRNIQSRLQQVGDDHIRCAHLLCNDQAHESDGSRPQNQHVIAEADVCTTTSVNANAQRLEKGSLLHRYVIWEFLFEIDERKSNIDNFTKLPQCHTYETKVSWMSVESSQIAIVRWSRTEDHIRTQVVAASLAEFTLTTAESWLDCNSIADLQVRHLSATLCDNARSFMSNNHRLRYYEVTNTAVNEIVHVRAANANAVHLQKNL